ncbi:MAG: MerR family transcriptional regulator, partial [Nakamurella sp.]
ASGGGVPQRDRVTLIRDRVAPALAAGIDPASDSAGRIVTASLNHCVAAGSTGTASEEILSWLVAVNDPQRERYLTLLSVINQWPPPESLAPVVDWTIAALQARVAG